MDKIVDYQSNFNHKLYDIRIQQSIEDSFWRLVGLDFHFSVYDRNRRFLATAVNTTDIRNLALNPRDAPPLSSLIKSCKIKFKYYESLLFFSKRDVSISISLSRKIGSRNMFSCVSSISNSQEDLDKIIN